MELHDIIVESSRYSLDNIISTKEEDVQPPPGLNNLDAFSLKPRTEPASGVEPAKVPDPNLDSIWTPSRKCELNSPTPMVSSNAEVPTMQTTTITHAKKLNLESPPEAAIEATPETTPFVTPVKDEVFQFTRPQATSTVSRRLNLDAKIKSPATASMTSVSTASILSPALSSKEPSPFRFPPEHHNHQTLERRDSIFCGPGDIGKVKPPVTPATPAAQGVCVTPMALGTDTTL